LVHLAKAYITFLSDWVSILFLLLVLSCEAAPPSKTLPEKININNFSTTVSLEDTLLSTPNILRFADNFSSLFVYDAGRGEILELTSEGDLKAKFGRIGRGPGEYIRINNLFIIDNNLYVVDPFQFVIHKYKLDGKWISTARYRLKNVRPNTPLAPFSSSTVVASTLENQPFVTLSGKILLSGLNNAI